MEKAIRFQVIAETELLHNIDTILEVFERANRTLIFCEVAVDSVSRIIPVSISLQSQATALR
jgi:hypothetical protein